MRSGRRLLGVLLTAGVAAVACSGSSLPRTATSDTPVLDVPFVEERALLLLMADRKLYEPLAVQRALAGDDALRAETAITIGRIGDSRGRPTLEGLLLDRASEVRQAAAFGLGLLADPAAARSLLAACRESDAAAARLAVEALAKIGIDLETVVGALNELPGDASRERLLPALWRFDEVAKVALAESYLEAVTGEARRWAAYALGRDTRPESAAANRALLADPDPWIRGWAARALGAAGSGGDLASVGALLSDGEATPVVQTLRALSRLVDDGRAAPSEEVRPHLRELLDDPRPGVRLTAIETAGRWLPDEQLSRRLEGYATAGPGRPSELALVALARGGALRGDLLSRSARSADPALRRAAVTAAAEAGAGELLAELAADRDPGVRVAALEARVEAAEQPAPLLTTALADLDPVVRGKALELAIERPVVDVARLTRAFADPASRRLVEVRLNGVRAIVARASVIDSERAAAAATLETLATGRELALRRAAGDGLEELGFARPPLGSLGSLGQVALYRQIVERTRGPRVAELATGAGVLRLRLESERAPLTVLNFLQLAGQGFYDGLSFHRVVPDFVVQAGDPRGDGWGGPGYTLRDEINRIPYERGVLGMALAGADTGGSQFFITLSRQPHLDGAYTAFGRVVGDLSQLDEIVQGERIESLREVPTASLR